MALNEIIPPPKATTSVIRPWVFVSFVPRQKKRATVKIIGLPELKLGDAVNISTMPNDQQNGIYKVISVQQLFNTQKGFITKIKIEEN